MTVVTDVDLRTELGEARDQRQRPTCLAFAISAAHEVSRKIPEYLSTEFLFYFGVRRSHGNPKRGLSCTAASYALRDDGQPVESAWPYLPDSPDASTWRVPAISVASHKAVVAFVPRTLAEIRALVSAGVPVVLVVVLTVAMYAPDQAGIVRVSPTDRPVASKHALLAVGSGRGVDGEYILVRNSWGRNWGILGHGWLHDAYLAAQLQNTGVIL